jgi:glucosamine 6-phosphate synthetase-like amidotransferase/phosphosugar isomerase protein
MKDKTLGATENALEQIVARGGRPLVICPQGYVPSTSAVTLPTIEVPEVVDCLQVGE